MSDQKNKTKIEQNSVVSLDYTLKVDGGVVDTSEGSEPIEFIQGQGQIIPGLESELYGMSIGDSKDVVISPSQGYGEIDSEAFADIPREEFPPNIPLEEGVALQLKDQDGNVLEAHIVEAGEKTVRLNFNHPLAGKELHFSVKVVGIREASDEEISHGHVHHHEHGNGHE
jgi:FKBP-type peptidyl-prolyl cis-trans isomerase SlyD